MKELEGKSEYQDYPLADISMVAIDEINKSLTEGLAGSEICMFS